MVSAVSAKAEKRHFSDGTPPSQLTRDFRPLMGRRCLHSESSQSLGKLENRGQGQALAGQRPHILELRLVLS